MVSLWSETHSLVWNSIKTAGMAGVCWWPLPSCHLQALDLPTFYCCETLWVVYFLRSDCDVCQASPGTSYVIGLGSGDQLTRPFCMWVAFIKQALHVKHLVTLWKQMQVVRVGSVTIIGDFWQPFSSAAAMQHLDQRSASEFFPQRALRVASSEERDLFFKFDSKK